jgi:hypothetical protein
MIARVIEFSARNRFVMVLLIAAIVASGIWAIYNTPLDAIPDLSDVQVIVYTEWEDRSPDIIEDQLTYPIVTQLLSAPRVKAVRANSFYGFSLIYVIFHDGTDLYWARSRVLEYMSGLAGKLPESVSPQLGPDATGVGWGLEYALIDRTGKHNLAELRSLQDWNLRYQLLAVPGVAEVAPVGAFVKQYQVTSPSIGSSRGFARATRKWAAESLSSPAANTWCAVAATSRKFWTSRKSAWARKRMARRSACATWASSRLVPTFGAGSSITTAWAMQRAALWSSALARASMTC